MAAAFSDSEVEQPWPPFEADDDDDEADKLRADSCEDMVTVLSAELCLTLFCSGVEKK
jgi:hypothetical protein